MLVGPFGRAQRRRADDIVFGGKVGLLIETTLDQSAAAAKPRAPGPAGQRRHPKWRLIPGQSRQRIAASAIRCSFGQCAPIHSRRGRQREKAAT